MKRPRITEQLSAQNYTVEDFIQTLQQKAAGNRMYLRYVVDEIARGQQTLDDLATLPESLIDYYAQAWNHWRTSSEWDTLYAPVLGTLAVTFARDSITAEMLKQWAGVSCSTYELRRRLREEWGAFIYELPGAERRYRFCHASLSDFFVGKTGEGQTLPG
ncbi:MAG TPA: hypothetical protein VKR06_11955, partial [Ktedonosporobacter sp.]|nr:hypothetical protein [Ktedonosporobacter sp.]